MISLKMLSGEVKIQNFILNRHAFLKKKIKHKMLNLEKQQILTIAADFEDSTAYFLT